MTGPSLPSLVAEIPGTHLTPQYPYAEVDGGRAVLVARVDKAVTVGTVQLMRFGLDGWYVPSSSPSGANRTWWVGIALEKVAAKRGRSPNSEKQTGEWAKFQIAGLYKDAVLPATLTPTAANPYIGYTGSGGALAIGSNAKHKAVWAKDVSATLEAGTTKDLMLFGHPVYTA